MVQSEVLEVVMVAFQRFADNEGIEFEGTLKPTQRLIGKGGILDSMDLVSFVVDLEETLEEKYGRYFSIQDERAMSRTHSPFLNLEELSKFIMEIDADR